MPQKLLFVEDEAGLLEDLVAIFKKEGYTTVGCTSRAEVEEAVSMHHSFDLVILDGNLGDGHYGHDSISGRIVTEILVPNRIKYARYSGDLDYIPEDLHGEFTVAKRMGSLKILKKEINSIS